MSKSTDTSIKLLVLYDILSKMTDEEHALSTNEIIAELNKRGIPVSRKVLPSDIALLNKYGYEILSYVKKARYYYVAQHTFDTAEITMLVDAIRASKLTEQRKNTLTDKLYSTVGLHRNPQSLENIITLNTSMSGNSSIVYNIDFIDRAIREKKKISFLYFTLDENKKKCYRSNKKRYVFNPLTMIWNKDNYYLLCYDDKHDGLSRYRIDRMDDVQIEEAPCLEKDEFANFNVDTYRKQIFSMFGGELQEVEIQFDKDMLGDIFDRFGTDIKIGKIDDNTFKSAVDVQISRTFFIWVVGTLGKVKVISPISVVDEFGKFVEQIQDSYGV